MSPLPLAMRIVGGAARGRRLKSLRGRATRPTAERVREALFDILGPRVEGARILDLFAGTGALGLEALSRGAERVVFVEKDPGAFRLLAENVALLGFGAGGRLVRGDVGRILLSLAREGRRFDLALLDPPYRTPLLRQCLESLRRAGVLERGAWAVAEHWAKEGAPESAGELKLFRVCRYGDTALSFYEFAGEALPEGAAGAGERRQIVEN